MKRARKSSALGTENSNPTQLIQSFSISDLPSRILVGIFLTLPTKSIVFCKSVCKKWNTLISNPHFSKLHFAQAKPQFLLRTRDSTRSSRTLFLVDIEENGTGFNRENESHTPNKPSIILNTKLKIPLRNAEVLLNNNNNDEGPNNKGNRRLKLKPKDHNYNIVNSCKGLLCLSEHSRNDPVAVANPVTGEFVKLPRTCNDLDCKTFVDCGLGFSPKSKKFKVVRIFSGYTAVTERVVRQSYGKTVAEVHTLGTDSWRSVTGAVPYSFKKLAFPTYINGALYAFCINNKESDCIVSFLFDNEQFEPVPLPPQWKWRPKRRNVSMGVLGVDQLCVCDTSDVETTKIWVMKDDGVSKSWTQFFTIYTDWPCGLCQPLNHFKNGALLMFSNCLQELIYSDQKHFRDKYLGIHGLKSRYEAIVHTPSFVSLKDIVVGPRGTVDILNINSRCGKLKLQGETKTHYLVEQHKEMGPLNCSSNEVEVKYWTKHFWSK
ncbi:F-box protein At3g07870-like [Humulus lupulus]|uniref:F-box protein At3g07870-like n=1 Tax=Humulus lupulus TaxID=3486 RepID=UPI002B403890|nr:F-box protein At3g07870-like [Humulus lupulus]XP_062105813.1 F-box protein At3g07870-like [Humulus lupulus]